jgi:hypothetical protein
MVMKIFSFLLHNLPCLCIYLMRRMDPRPQMLGITRQRPFCSGKSTKPNFVPVLHSLAILIASVSRWGDPALHDVKVPPVKGLQARKIPAYFHDSLDALDSRILVLLHRSTNLNRIGGNF